MKTKAANDDDDDDVMVYGLDVLSGWDCRA